MYYHIIDQDTNETVATYTDPVKAAARALTEAATGRNVSFEAPSTCQVGDRWCYPGQLLSVEDVA